MSLVAVKISADVLKDMLDLFAVQPWLLGLHEEMVQLWNLCETREEQSLIKKLISDICMLDSAKELLACKGINNVIQEWGLTPETTWIVAAANSSEIDGSAAGLQKLKNKIVPVESWGSRFIGNIPAAVEKIKENQTIVIFDDFIGSGDKIMKKRKWLTKLLAEKEIKNNKYYYIGFSGMNFGVDNIRKTEKAEVYTYLSLKKGITETYTKPEADRMITVMIEIESRLAPSYKNKKISDFSLGYGKSEALYFGQNDNCPNNVFPILWWPYLKNGESLKTILNRVG